MAFASLLLLPPPLVAALAPRALAPVALALVALAPVSDTRLAPLLL